MAIDAQWSSVVLLCPFEGADGSTTITDVKGHVVTVAGNAQISTAQYPAGCSSSAKFDGNNDYLTISHADLALGTGDFDIGFSIYVSGDTVSGSSNTAHVFDFRTTEPQVAINIAVRGSAHADANKMLVYINGAQRILSTTVFGASFKRVNLSKVSGVTRLFVDGVQEGANYTDANNYTTTSMNIGAIYTPSSGDYRSINGHVGPIRITKHGRGHSTSFTPDSLPFPRPTISGTAYDNLGAEVDNVVVAMKRSTLALAGYAVSDAVTGEYTIYPSDFSEHIVMRLDADTYPLVDGGLGESAIIYDRVIPG